MTRYRLRASGIAGVLLPVLLGVLLLGVGLDAVLRAGGPLAWVLLVTGVVWTVAWLRLPWALRLDSGADQRPAEITFLGPLRRTTMPASAITSVTGRWSGGMNRWFLASVWVESRNRVLGFPLLVGFSDPDAVREHLLLLNPDIRMDN